MRLNLLSNKDLKHDANVWIDIIKNKQVMYETMNITNMQATVCTKSNIDKHWRNSKHTAINTSNTHGHTRNGANKHTPWTYTRHTQTFTYWYTLNIQITHKNIHIAVHIIRDTTHHRHIQDTHKPSPIGTHNHTLHIHIAVHIITDTTHHRHAKIHLNVHMSA